MKSRIPGAIIPGGIALLALFSPVSGAERTDHGPAAATGESAPKKSRQPLEKGMSGDLIVQLIGKPASVAPIKTAEGNAEAWTYRRLVDTQVYQSADAQTTIPTFMGFTADGPMIGDSVIPVYRLKHQKIYQVTSLLMFDGKLVVAKQWRERSESYVD